MNSAERIKMQLYEATCQSPEWIVAELPKFYRRWFKREARVLLEDFAGSALVATTWVQQSQKNSAIAVDHHAKYKQYFKKNHESRLTKSQGSRIEYQLSDVRLPILRSRQDQKRSRNDEAIDWIVALNYSVFEMLDRDSLIAYLRRNVSILSEGGAVFLEVTGGFDLLQPNSELTEFEVPNYGVVRQYFESHQFDPLRGVNEFSIHFEWIQKNKKRFLNDAFQYRWRLWGIPDLREALVEVGFDEVKILWQKSNQKGEGTGRYLEVNQVEPAPRYLAFVVGIRRDR